MRRVERFRAPVRRPEPLHWCEWAQPHCPIVHLCGLGSLWPPNELRSSVNLWPPLEPRKEFIRFSMVFITFHMDLSWKQIENELKFIYMRFNLHVFIRCSRHLQGIRDFESLASPSPWRADLTEVKQNIWEGARNSSAPASGCERWAAKRRPLAMAWPLSKAQSRWKNLRLQT